MEKKGAVFAVQIEISPSIMVLNKEIAALAISFYLSSLKSQAIFKSKAITKKDPRMRRSGGRTYDLNGLALKIGIWAPFWGLFAIQKIECYGNSPEMLSLWNTRAAKSACCQWQM